MLYIDSCTRYLYRTSLFLSKYETLYCHSHRTCKCWYLPKPEMVFEQIISGIRLLNEKVCRLPLTYKIYIYYYLTWPKIKWLLSTYKELSLWERGKLLHINYTSLGRSIISPDFLFVMVGGKESKVHTLFVVPLYLIC